MRYDEFFLFGSGLLEFGTGILFRRAKKYPSTKYFRSSTKCPHTTSASGFWMVAAHLTTPPPQKKSCGCESVRRSGPSGTQQPSKIQKRRWCVDIWYWSENIWYWDTYFSARLKSIPVPNSSEPESNKKLVIFHAVGRASRN
jgi:hypothetical protein